MGEAFITRRGGGKLELVAEQAVPVGSSNYPLPVTIPGNGDYYAVMYTYGSQTHPLCDFLHIQNFEIVERSENHFGRFSGSWVIEGTQLRLDTNSNVSYNARFYQVK